jgi:hypothetical protein
MSGATPRDGAEKKFHHAPHNPTTPTTQDRDDEQED